MKQQTTLGKAFEINKNSGIYGTFAEIGAGQETVNFFYKAGLASQTVAKSMSAYDMTVSDEIYGKQSRYVSKERLITMLNHEYRLLDKRLKKKSGDKNSFFVFATTAATSTQKKTNLFLNKQHAWMGLRFQAKPLQAFNDIIFHVKCLDKSRLQQHEALGILGVNLIYAGFYQKDNPKKLVSSLIENLSGSRIEIHGMSCTGPEFIKFSTLHINLEILLQNLSPAVFFPNPENSAFLLDFAFGKNLVVLYENQNLIKHFRKNKSKFLKSLLPKDKNPVVISFIPKKQLKILSFKNQLKELCKEGFSVVAGVNSSLEELKRLIAPHTEQPITFVVSEDYFKNQMFDCKNNLLKSLAEIFDKKTRVAVLSQNKNFSVQKQKLGDSKNLILKDYLIAKKQIIDLK